MHSTAENCEKETNSGGALLDPGKNNCAGWRPGRELPKDWGQTGSTCGGVVASKVEDGVETFVPVLCKRWSCDLCSYYRHAWLVRNIAQEIESGRLWCMWTLTLQADRSPEDSFDDLQRAWAKLRGRIAREYGGLEYVWVVETTQRGIAHLHVMVDRRLDWHWMSAAWLECTGDSNVVRFDRIRDAGAGRYVAKYVGKEVASRRERKLPVAGRHLFGTSQGIRFDAFMPQGKGWVVVQLSWRENAEWLRKNAVIVEDRVAGGVPRISVLRRSSNIELKRWGDVRALKPPPGGFFPPGKGGAYSAVAELERRLGGGDFKRSDISSGV